MYYRNANVHSRFCTISIAVAVAGATNAVYTQGDGNFDGVVNQADYDVWRSHFGQTP